MEIGGKEIEIPYNKQKALLLVESAKEILADINEKIEKNSSETNILELILSNPYPESCKYCNYRPSCKPYWEKRETHLSEEWPEDIKGKITRIEKQGDGLISIEITQELEKLEKVNIRGITPSRHVSLKIGNVYIICNLTKETGKNNYKENRLTTIYPFK
jgi:hypothetical protein